MALLRLTGMLMIRSLVFTTAGLLAAGSLAIADESLLSDVRIDSVFESESESSQTVRPKTVRLRGIERLTELLRDADFEVTSSGSRTVKTRKKLGQWSFPVFVAISEDERQIEFTLALSTVKEGNQVDTEKLLTLMEANRGRDDSQFSFSRARKRIELFFALENDRITAQKLRDEINRLAVRAKENASVWKIGVAISPAGTDETKKAADVGTGITLTGNWSSARSATEAFALRFNADRTFVLVYVNSGKQTRSTGKFTRTGQTLDLVGNDGSKLSGTLTGQSQKQFQPTGSAALTFKKSNL